MSFNVKCLCVIRKPLRAFKRPHISRYLRNEAALTEKLPILAAHSIPVWRLLCSNPRENTYKPLLLRNYSSLATFLLPTFMVYVHSVTLCQLWKPQHTYIKRAVRKVHFNMNRTFKVIPGHPYWCQQKSRTDCCHNVQQCRLSTLFPKLTTQRYCENCKFVDSNHPTLFDDINLRNAFEYLQKIYIGRN